MACCVAKEAQKSLPHTTLSPCRPPPTNDEDDYVPPGKVQIVADIDYAQVVGLSDEPDYVPSWYQEDLGAELRHSQVQAQPHAPHCISKRATAHMWPVPLHITQLYATLPCCPSLSDWALLK